MCVSVQVLKEDRSSTVSTVILYVVCSTICVLYLLYYIY